MAAFTRLKACLSFCPRVWQREPDIAQVRLTIVSSNLRGAAQRLPAPSAPRTSHPGRANHQLGRLNTCPSSLRARGHSDFTRRSCSIPANSASSRFAAPGARRDCLTQRPAWRGALRRDFLFDKPQSSDRLCPIAPRAPACAPAASACSPRFARIASTSISTTIRTLACSSEVGLLTLYRDPIWAFLPTKPSSNPDSERRCNSKTAPESRWSYPKNISRCRTIASVEGNSQNGLNLLHAIAPIVLCAW